MDIKGANGSTKASCVPLFKTHSKHSASRLFSQASTSHVDSTEKEITRLEEREVYSLLVVCKPKFNSINQAPTSLSISPINSESALKSNKSYTVIGLKDVLSINRVLETLLSYLTYNQITSYKWFLVYNMTQYSIKQDITYKLLSVYLNTTIEPINQRRKIKDYT